MIIRKTNSGKAKNIGKKGALILAIITMVFIPTVIASSVNVTSVAAVSDAISSTISSQATSSNSENSIMTSVINSENGQPGTSSADVSSSGSSQTISMVNGVSSSDTSNSEVRSDNIATTISSGTTSYSSTSSTSTANTNIVQTISDQISSNDGKIKDGGAIIMGSYEQAKDGIIKTMDKIIKKISSNGIISINRETTNNIQAVSDQISSIDGQIKDGGTIFIGSYEQTKDGIIKTTTTERTTLYNSISTDVMATNDETIKNEISSKEEQIKDNGIIFIGSYEQAKDGSIRKV